MIEELRTTTQPTDRRPVPDQGTLAHASPRAMARPVSAEIPSAQPASRPMAARVGRAARLLLLSALAWAARAADAQSVAGWGDIPLGTFADVSNIVKVAAGRYHTVALKADGTLACLSLIHI